MKKTKLLLILGSVTVLVLCSCHPHRVTNVTYTYSGEDVAFIDFDIEPSASTVYLNDVECLLIAGGTHAHCAVSKFSTIEIETR